MTATAPARMAPKQPKRLAESLRASKAKIAADLALILEAVNGPRYSEGTASWGHAGELSHVAAQVADVRAFILGESR